MSNYSVSVCWKCTDKKFTNNRYSRLHHWKFDGGETILASSSPQIVPAPLSDPSAVDPEEAFIASLASCHMLWFLSIAAKSGFSISSYEDSAKGIMENNLDNRLAITEVVLRPHVKYLRNLAPSLEKNIEMHHEAHEKCFIANSVRTVIEIEPRMSKVKTKTHYK